MSGVVLTVNPGHSLREAARSMAERNVGAAVVIDPEQPGPGILTERDLLQSIGAGQSPDSEKVADHLVIVDGGELVGVISMGDIVRCWVSDGATSEMPGPAAEVSG